MNYTPQNLSRWKRPSCYIGAEWSGYFVAPVRRNRDSSILEKCNWDSQWEILNPLRADCVDADGEELSSPVVVLENHWACGWVVWVAIHESNDAALRAADEIAERLERRPILNEDALSDAERSAYNEAWESWGARDFRRELVATFELSQAAEDALDGIENDALRGLYENAIPSGEFFVPEGDGVRLNTKYAADFSPVLSRDVLAGFLRQHRRQPVSA